MDDDTHAGDDAHARDDAPNPRPSTTVSSVDDHEIISVAVERLVDSADDLAYGSSASTVDELLAARPGLGADDLVLLDLRLGDGSSPVGNVRRLTATGARVVAFTSGESPYLVRLAATTDALGVISKSTSGPQLLELLRRAASGAPVVSTEWAAALASDPALPDAALSPRESDVLALFAAGNKAQVVATTTGISVATVDDYVRRIRDKYARAGRPAPTKVDLYKRAVEDGFLPLPGDGA